MGQKIPRLEWKVQATWQLGDSLSSILNLLRPTEVQELSLKGRLISTDHGRALFQSTSNLHVSPIGACQRLQIASYSVTVEEPSSAPGPTQD